MKKILSILLLNLFIFGLAFGATINSKEGYAGLAWGSTKADATKVGYRFLSSIESPSSYLVSVEAFNVSSKDKKVTGLQFHYYKEKLFFVTETLSIKELTPKKLESRYGNFSQQGIFLSGKKYTDAVLAKDGSVSSISIIISTNSEGYVTAVMYDWDVYKSISSAGQKLAKVSKASIADELEEIANKLVQGKADVNKPSYAFLALTTDYQNSLVDNYVTDALTEAMFNTGKIKIIERANLEAILEEQHFQSSGLVNEATAKSIGMIAGADFICFGTLKDLGSSITVNARVVDVETGELCAIARTTITKDDYLRNQPQSAVAASTASKTSSYSAKTATSTTTKTTASSTNSAWKVMQYKDEFAGCKHYIFTINSSDSRMLFIDYKKADNQATSRVIAGVHWSDKCYDWNGGNGGDYDVKGTDGKSFSKHLEGNDCKCFLDESEKNFFYYGYSPKESARWLVEMMVNSDSVAVRRDGLTRRFQTSGLLYTMAQYGITWEEIDAALANEEF